MGVSNYVSIQRFDPLYLVMLHLDFCWTAYYYLLLLFFVILLLMKLFFFLIFVLYFYELF